MSSLEQEIKNFLLKVGLPQYSNKLINEDVTMTILEQMTHDDLKSVGISSFGHRFSIMKGLESYSRDSIEDNPVLEEGTTVQVLEEGTTSQVSQDDPNITEDVDTLGVYQDGNNDDNQQVIFRSQSKRTNSLKIHKLSTHGDYQNQSVQIHRVSQRSTLNVSINKDSKYPCDQCVYQFSKQGDVKRHIISIHKGVKYNCDQCEYQSTRQDTLKMHNKSVHDGLKYSCDQCQYQASYQRTLKRHKDRVHEYEVKHLVK